MDALDSQIQCVLLQADDKNILHPLGYWSLQLNAAEGNYVWATTHLFPYFERTHFVVRTDHSAFQYLLNISGDNARLVRWRLRLSECTFDIQYLPDRVNQGVDTISRMVTSGGDQLDLDQDVPCLSVEVTPVVSASIAVPAEGPTLVEKALESLTVSDVIEAHDTHQMCKEMGRYLKFITRYCFVEPHH
jgi:hypothetical protein